VVFPIPGGRSRVIAAVGKTDPAHPRADPTLPEAQAMIDSRTGGGFRATDPVWLSNFGINERLHHVRAGLLAGVKIPFFRVMP